MPRYEISFKTTYEAKSENEARRMFWEWFEEQQSFNAEEIITVKKLED